MFEDIRRYALPHGYPIMITEFGAVAKKLPGGGSWNTRERVLFTKHFLRRASSLGIPCFWWDNNYLDRRDEYFGLFDRERLQCLFPEIVEALTASCFESGSETVSPSS